MKQRLSSEPNPPPEQHENLWLLIAAPSIWALHFLLCYATAAVWCAKIAPRLGGARMAIGAYTLIAAVVIAWLMIDAWRRHASGDARVPHGRGSAADRHRFLGFAALLLAALSLVSTLFVGAVALFIGSCA